MLTKSNVSGFTLIPVLFVLTLFLLLSALSVSVIMAGSAVHEKISADMDANYERRVTFSYFATKIRQNDKTGIISVEKKHGVDMIAIKESESETTYIYYFDGYVRELFVDDDTAFELDWGEGIIQAGGFDFDFDENKNEIKMSLTDQSGEVQSTKVYLRSGG
ncbi:MAG: DUF4860 domain-containing protein [Oscillospiraceae bacterium]|nr:DUF4860 domain-containing protein [Oscillospiraceae bacterium]